MGGDQPRYYHHQPYPPLHVHFAVLSELLRPWRRMEFKDQPDLQGQGGGTGAYIGDHCDIKTIKMTRITLTITMTGEPDRPDWLSRPLGAAKDRQS